MTILCAALAAAGVAVLLASIDASALPDPPYTECPAIGQDSGCAILIDVTNSGTQVLQDNSQGPYDGTDDTLIGVLNESSSSVLDLPLTSTTDIFGFDGDGICTYQFTGDSYCQTNADGGPSSGSQQTESGGVDPYDYEGPINTFSDISEDQMTGVVDFTTPLGPGQSTYFSLENALTATQITPLTSTSLSTMLSGDSQSGASISVPENTAVTDSATLSGANASSATGTVTYDVYSDQDCTVLVDEGPMLAITSPGSLPASTPVSLATPGTFYWQATYSGDDTANAPSMSNCESEVETVLIPQAVTITSTPPADAVVGNTYPLTATGGGSGNPVVFSIAPSAAGVCSVTGSLVTLSGVGTCVVYANQAGNATYAAADQATQSFGVGAAPAPPPPIPPPTSITVPCLAGELCSENLPTSFGSVQFSGTSSTAGDVSVSLQNETVDCGTDFDYAAQFTQLTDTNFTSSSGLTIVDTNLNATQPRLFEVCYQSSTPFRDLQGSMVTVGLLPSCKVTSDVAPCVISSIKQGANVVVTFRVPAGDPAFHAGKKKHPAFHSPG